jgi:hypothetical protein
MPRAPKGGYVRWDGLEELYRWLRTLPDELTEEATGIVETHALGAKDEITAAYPIGPTRRRKGQLIHGGHLKAGMKASKLSSSRWGINYLVANRAPHAWIYEHGTEMRTTNTGARRGRSPAHNVFIPRAMKWRRRMYQALKAMMVRHGLRVTGDAELGTAA